MSCDIGVTAVDDYACLGIRDSLPEYMQNSGGKAGEAVA